MSIGVSGAVNLMSKSKLKDEIMNSTIKTRYQVDAQCMSAKYTLVVINNMGVLIWVIAWVKITCK